MKMGKFSVEVTLRNPVDVANARNGLIDEKDIRQAKVEAVVDTGAPTMVITEKVREQLGLAIDCDGYGKLADGSRVAYKQTDAVEIRYKDRKTHCSAYVLKDGDHCLLGAIAMEGMVLKANPVEMRLEPIYTGDFTDMIDEVMYLD
jgi:clan AA aspartic protease